MLDLRRAEHSPCRRNCHFLLAISGARRAMAPQRHQLLLPAEDAGTPGLDEKFPVWDGFSGPWAAPMRLSERIISGAWLRTRLNRPPGCAMGALYEALATQGVEVGEARRHPMLVDIKAAAPAPGLGNPSLVASPVARQGERGSRVTSDSPPSNCSWGCMSGQFALSDRL